MSESTPLVDFGVPGQRNGLISPKGNIYTYILFVPPMALKKHGHYFSKTVIVAFLLLFLNIFMQVALTIIAGTFIVDQNSLFLLSLVRDESGANTHLLQERISNIINPLRWMSEISHYEIIEQPSDCCTGAKCADAGVPCCTSLMEQAANPVAENVTQPFLGVSLAAFFSERLWPELLSRRPRANSRKRRLSYDSKSGVRSALCLRLDNKSLDCAPPLEGFVHEWGDLDADGDGNWSLSEAKADAANLGCRLGVPVDDALHHAAHAVAKDAMHKAPAKLELPGALLKRTEIARDYFDWWAGLMSICSVADPDRCGTLLQQGVFDGAFAPGTSGEHGGVTDLERAMQYCNWVLKPGGLCDGALHSSYTMYRSQRSNMCGHRVLSLGQRYTNPHDQEDTYIPINVDYSHVIKYSTVHALSFQFFLMLILLLWYVNLIDELVDNLELADFVRNFPSEEHGSSHTVDNEAQKDSGPADDVSLPETEGGLLVIRGISSLHRWVCVCLVLLRLWLFLYMANVGTAFILSTHSFPDLLLNALALAFIFELPEFLFRSLAATKIKRTLDNVAPLRFSSSFPASRLGKLFFSKYAWGMVVFPVLSIGVVINNDKVNIAPVLEALTCACNQSGERCLLAAQFSRAWWDKYWASIARLSALAAMEVARPAAGKTVAAAGTPAALNSSMSLSPALLQVASHVAGGLTCEL